MVAFHCLGTGLVGSYVARYLSNKGYEVHAYDRDLGRISREKNVILHHVEEGISPHDYIDSPENGIVINMLPGSIGYASTSALLEKPTKIIDLSFCRSTPENDDERAVQNGSTVLWDVGIAPGFSNMLVKYADDVMGPLKEAKIWVGGNPTVPTGKWKYMAPFSPSDVIEEYIRPARVIREGDRAVLPALSERHFVEVSGTGEMEAFLTDGLRSLITTVEVQKMSEYTVRWPGHIQCFIDMRENGSLDHDELISSWEYDSEVAEFTWLKVSVESEKGEVMEWNLRDDGGKDGHSMARTTGLVTSVCAEAWIEDSTLLSFGVHPPESLSHRVAKRVIQVMRDRGIVISGPDIIPVHS